LEKEVDSMSKEEAGLGGGDDEVIELFLLLALPFEIECAQLWYKELQVISEDASKIWVDSALLSQSLDGFWVMRVESDQVLDD
jgi:hypothetical protein